ncbi:transglycosylase domain-containing protein [Hyphomicrobium sulfonivorans]|uniref:transglycosylase domain-containing protein n=1 Tax=Hyphomicrobium sulfonivorans TaxID=121290 RepID=UPI00156F5718|nr:transglycosylase domain-containing protein [Hyphomicrobium sulfonivorans]MBI1648719.1 transglycosylase domain-containing protein [Hyphomicrobium sulfonivorans]NSL70746.1 glycosyl transferase family 51 [Hyphomicrobium sulfonivorans]
MLVPFRVLFRAVELLLLLPLRILQLLFSGLAFNPRLGVLRYVFGAALVYVVFAVALVYVLAPIRGEIGHYTLGPKLHYDAERWLATALHDSRGSFVGTFDPRLDSLRDVNFTGEAIDLGAYVANPDHKSIPVRQVPESFWQCIVYHEDRNLGGLLNPFGIDLPGVLKIPFSTVRRSVASRRPVLGVGGSTLSMQFVRVIYKTPPHSNEGAFIKLKRKLTEWWLAPVVYRELTAGGDDAGLKQWAANHLWLAQRTGGSPLHGIEVTSRIVFGKEAADLTVAEQFVLASAVNRPIILLEGSERLNAVRLDRWRYIIEVRARTCAEKLITDEAQQKEVLFELVAMASGPPDPKMKPRLHRALEAHAPALATVAQANPVIRANALLPSARYGIREEMKQRFGFAWREHIRGVTTTLDAAQNLDFRDSARTALATINTRYADRISPGYTLDPAAINDTQRSPGVVIAAANARGEIVRYYEQGDNAAYFGSPFARRADDGHYDANRESRMVASTGKILAAIAIANTLRDTPQSVYVDPRAPTAGLDTCARGNERQGRSALVSFACSLNEPLLTRTAQIGQRPIKRLIDGFGFTMPPPNANGEGTPPSTAAVLGQIAGAPRRVHHMAGAVLASLTGNGAQPLPQPTLIKSYDFALSEPTPSDELAIVPNRLIRADGRSTLRALLEAPLCHQAAGRAAGTLKELAHWCARRRNSVQLHFAKTGTQVTEDRDATVDAWIAGGVQFSNGAAYSYVVVVGTGSGSQPWAHKLHAAQVAAPLVDALLADLEAEALGRQPRKRTAGTRSAAASN